MTDTSTVSGSLPFTTPTVQADANQPVDLSTFKFKHIGQPPTLLNRFTAPEPGHTYNYRSPSVGASSDMDLGTPAKPLVMGRGPRKSLLEALASESQQQEIISSPSATTTQPTQPENTTNSRSSTASDASPPSISVAAINLSNTPPNSSHSNEAMPTTSPLLPSSTPPDPSQTLAHPASSVVPATIISGERNHQYLDDISIYAPSSPSPLAIIDHLEDIVRERTDLDKLRDLTKQFVEEREELSRRNAEAVRAVQRSTEQANRVMFISEEALSKTEMLILKHQKRLDEEKKKAQADIEAKRAAEKQEQLRRQVQESEKRRKEEKRKEGEEAERLRKEAETRRNLEEALRLEEEKKREIEERRKEEDRLKAEEAKQKLQEQEKEERAREKRVKLEERRKEEMRQMEERRKEEMRQIEERRKEEMRQMEERRKQEIIEAEAKRRAEYDKKRADVHAKKWSTIENNSLPLKTSNPPPSNPAGQDRSSINNPQASSTPSLPSPPSSIESGPHPSPDHSLNNGSDNAQDHLPDTTKDDRRSSSAIAKRELQASFVPATTAAGKLISADIPLASVRSEGDTTKQKQQKSTAVRNPQTKSKKARRKEQQVVAKKEPQSPSLPALQEQAAPRSGNQALPLIPPATVPMRVPVPSGPTGDATTTAPIALAVVPTARPPPDSVVHPIPEPTRERQRPLSRSRSPPYRGQMPRLHVRGRSPVPSISPPPSPRRSRSPGARASRPLIEHYSRQHADHWSPGYYRPGVDPVRREYLPTAPHLPKKRPRDSDYWVASDDPRTGGASKRRIVREPSPMTRIAPRSPPSPRVRQSQWGAALPTSSDHQQSPNDIRESRRKQIPDLPKNPSKWLEGRNVPQRPAALNSLPPRPTDAAASAGLLNRMSDRRSPPGTKAGPNRKNPIPLEHRLTSVPNPSTPLGERLS